MRFSALQEDGYGLGLGQDRFPNDVDESMMAATGDMDPDGGGPPEKGSMTSNLPLLFANGYPTSLEKITLLELERFITFMVQCSLGHDTAEVIRQPQWWPKEVKFSNPFVRPKTINDNWIGSLKKLVFRCYTYHRSEYLLRFCSYLTQYPRENLEYVNNWDSTTSLYLKSTRRLLVTFRNENMNYDKKIESPRKMLLPFNGVTSAFPSKTKAQHQLSLVVVQPPNDDIYLCDNCDAELIGFDQMKEHERICCDQEQSSSNSRPSTPDVLCIQPEMEQNQFLAYFHLLPPESANVCSNTSKEIFINQNNATRSSRRIRGAVNMTRCPTIPFSSPAGIAMAKKSKMMSEGIQQERLERIERHLTAPPLLSSSSRPKWLDRVTDGDRWNVTYKTNREKLGRDVYSHEYKFNNFRNKPVLNIRSQLLYVACQPIYVSMTSLNQEQIQELQHDPSKYKSPVRQVPRPRLRSLKRQQTAMSQFPFGHSGEEVIVIDDEEIVPEEMAMATLTPIGRVSGNVYTRPNSYPARPANIAVKRHRTKVKNSRSTSAIMVVDLCSSDEEESSSKRISTDENKDPMDCSEPETSFSRTFSSGKFCPKPCIYPVDATNNRYAVNNLSADSDNRGNKCLGDVLKHSCTGFTPLLRQTP